MEITVKRYSNSDQPQWDKYVKESKNGTFLLMRNYMDYHADRFEDHSLLFFKEKKLIALLPANQKGKTIYSHQGLTYGGLILNLDNRAAEVLQIMEKLIAYYKENGFKIIIYKAIPHIYHTYPAEEDLYALFRNNAQLIVRNISTAIPLQNRIKFSRDRCNAIKRAKKNDLTVTEGIDFAPFWEILTQNLQQRHQATPVHNVKEITLLRDRFKQEIRLFEARLNNEIIAGCVTYDTGKVLHIQYISTNEKGREIGAMDMIAHKLFTDIFATKEIIEYGTSCEDNGRILNEGLIHQKEGFGGRAINYDTYEITL